MDGAIAVLGFAITIESYAFSISNVFTGMFLPKVTRLISSTKDTSSIFPFMVKAGKYQTLIIGLIFMGFVIFGKEFSVMLMGQEYESAYLCGILLLFPFLFNVPKETAETSSYVAGTIKDIALITIIFSTMCLAVSFLTGHFFGAIGVAATMCFFFMVISFTKDIWVFKKKQGLDMLLFYKQNLFRFIFPSLLVCK